MNEYLLPQSQSMGLPLPNTVSAPVEQDEAALITASQGGDQEAFAQLVQLHQRRIFNLTFRILRQYEEASEVTQETFLAAWQALPSFRKDARFSTWLYRIAYNCSMKQLEQRKRDQALQIAMQEERALERTSNNEWANAQLEERETQAFVREHLARLPAKYQIVLILRHLQDMSYEEMAEILTVPIGTIKTHLFRARNLLKERLEAFEREWKTRG
ncbi:MAG TPA: sigma-70 family RNA polymerase sigma factor [Ktedonobacteraceae bacterium]|nr:sigma-70 family RNA polymerase sigma factor [Ktedonobacteraceae bacterium]